MCYCLGVPEAVPNTDEERVIFFKEGFKLHLTVKAASASLNTLVVRRVAPGSQFFSQSVDSSRLIFTLLASPVPAPPPTPLWPTL